MDKKGLLQYLHDEGTAPQRRHRMSGAGEAAGAPGARLASASSTSPTAPAAGVYEDVPGKAVGGRAGGGGRWRLVVRIFKDESPAALKALAETAP